MQEHLIPEGTIRFSLRSRLSFVGLVILVTPIPALAQTRVTTNDGGSRKVEREPLVRVFAKTPLARMALSECIERAV